MTKVTWVAVYNDGTALAQFDTTGKEFSSEEIDRRKLKSMLLFFNGKVVLTQHFEPGQRLIFRRRVAITPGVSPDGSGDTREFVYLLGWQRTVGNENIQHIAYVFETSARIELAGKFDDRHAWFYEPKWLPCESQEVEKQ